MLAATAAEPRCGAQIVHLEPADHTGTAREVIGDPERASALTALLCAGTSIFATCVTSVVPVREQPASGRASSGENREHVAGPRWSGTTVRTASFRDRGFRDILLSEFLPTRLDKRKSGPRALDVGSKTTPRRVIVESASAEPASAECMDRGLLTAWRSRRSISDDNVVGMDSVELTHGSMMR
jgi:hypothetical protein